MMNTLKRLSRWLRGKCTALASAVRTFWHRLTRDPEYAQAAADLVASAIAFWCLTFCCQTQRLARIVAALVVPLRSMIRNRDSDDPTWELDPAWA